MIQSIKRWNQARNLKYEANQQATVHVQAFRELMVSAMVEDSLCCDHAAIRAAEYLAESIRQDAQVKMAQLRKISGMVR